MRRIKSGRVAFCGVMTALALTLLLLTSIPVTTIALAALAGMAGIPVVIEAGKRYSLLTYVSVGLLSLFLVPAIEGKALYIAFFGYYPIVKALLENRKWNRIIETVLKLLLFNAAMIGAYGVMLSFFSLDSSEFTIGGVSLPWVFLLAGNGVFLLYDWCLSRLISKYIQLWRPKVRRLFHF